MTAAYCGQVLALKTLRHRGAAIDVVDDNGKSCVFLAAQANHVPVLRVSRVFLCTPIHTFSTITLKVRILKIEYKQN